MADMKKLLHAFDEADEILNDKIERTNLSTIVASATASVENKKTVLIRGTGRNIESLKVGGRTVQDGVPTPDAPVEVKGVGDKTVNLWNEKYKTGYYATSNGTYKDSDAELCSVDRIIVDPNTPYYMVNGVDGLSFLWYTEDDTFISATRVVGTNVSPTNAKYARINLGSPYGSTYKNDVAVVKGTTGTYEPYNKYKIPVSCGGETTNIYLDSPLFEGESADLIGGITNKLYGIVKMKDLAWTSSRTNVFTTSSITDFKSAGMVISNCYTYGGTATGSQAVSGADNYVYNNGAKIVIVKDSKYDTQEAYMAALTDDMYLIYELDTSTTESFDTSPIPTASGNNELSIDTEVTPATIDVTSFGDYYSKAEINNIFNDLNSRIKFLEEHTIVGGGTITVPGMTGSPNTNSDVVVQHNE